MVTAFLIAKAAMQKCAGKCGGHRAEDFHRIPFPVCGISSCNACGPAFYRAYGRDKNIFLLTIPALVQDVINNGVLCGAVYGNFKVNARLFLADMDGLFSQSMSQNLNARMSQLRRPVCSANRRIA